MRTVVVGVGNLLLRDDGFGIHVIEKLKKMNVQAEIVDAMTNTAMLLAAIDGKDKAVIVDAISFNKTPGDIHVFRFNPREEEFPSDIMLSLHDIHFKDALNSARGIYDLPEEIVIIGVEPEKIEIGLELTEKCRKAIPEVIKLILQELNHHDNG